MLKDFKEFALKGNIIDLAVAVIIGGAFGKIISSLVSDILMPLIGILLGNADFTNLFITLGSSKTFKTIDEAKNAGVSTLNYGIFIYNIIDFLIIAFSIFFVLRQLNRFSKKKEVEVAVTSKKCKYCFTEIPVEATRCPHCTSVLEDKR